MRPTIHIKKRKIFEPKYPHHKEGWSKFYNLEKMDLNEVPFQTEGQLIWYIYQKYGTGHYMLLAWKKGRKGFWAFWNGVIEEDGFTFISKKFADQKENAQLLDDIEQEDDPEMKMMLKDMLQEEKKEHSKKLYGFVPWLKPSGRKGDFVMWEDCK